MLEVSIKGDITMRESLSVFEGVFWFNSNNQWQPTSHNNQHLNYSCYDANKRCRELPCNSTIYTAEVMTNLYY